MPSMIMLEFAIGKFVEGRVVGMSRATALEIFGQIWQHHGSQPAASPPRLFSRLAVNGSSVV